MAQTTLFNLLDDVLDLVGDLTTIVGDELDNVLVGTAGSDLIEGLGGADTLDGGAGDDQLFGGDDDDDLYGGDEGFAPIAVFLSSIGELVPAGTPGAKELLTGEFGILPNADFLDGGAGGDTMAGGTGDDSYVIDDVADVVLENAGEGFDAILSSIDIVMPDNVELLELDGDAISGIGNSGSNEIFGNGLANLLDGGAGDDALFGGEGDDTFVFGRDGGIDYVDSGGGFDVLQLAPDVLPADVVLSRYGNYVVVGIAGTEDRIELADWFVNGTGGRVHEIQFDDGTVWDEATIAELANQRVDVVEANDDFASVEEDGAPIAVGNVLDNDILHAPGSLIVTEFDSVAGIYGVLDMDNAGNFVYLQDNDSLAVQVLAQGESAYEIFDYEPLDGGGAYDLGVLQIEVVGRNDTPEVGAGTGGSVYEDAGENLLEDGGFDGGLASWDVAGNTGFSGTDALSISGEAAYSGAVGSATLLSQEVETLAGEQYLLSFYLRGGAASGTEFSVDWDGATLLTVGDTGQDGYRRYELLIDGTGDASQLEFSLRNDPGFWHLDEVHLGLLHDEPADQHLEGRLGFTDLDASDGHTVEIGAQGSGHLGTLTASIESDSFDGATGMVAWSFDASSAELNVLAEGQTRQQIYDLTVADPFGGSATQSVTVTLHGVNDGPVAVNDTGAAVENGAAVTLLGSALLANDIDPDAGDTKTITAVTNSAAGAQVTLVGGNAVYAVGGLFQTLKAGATATDTFTYTMEDSHGAESTASVTMTITGVNDAPTLANAIADQSATAGTPFTFTFAANTFRDVDVGDTLQYAATLGNNSPLPSWLTFNAATRTFSGTAPVGTTPLDLRVVATDGSGASASDTFALRVAGGPGGGIVPIVGTDRDDVLTGTSGNDVFDGREGYDKMTGGAGDDVYYVDETRGKVDLVVEGANGGRDTVYSSADYTLGSNVEELHLVGCEDLEGKGNSLANMVVGNVGDNELYGEGGNDLLLDDAGEDRLDGGAGDDVLDGGADDDTLVGGAGNDIYVHTRDGGDDEVQDSGGTDAIRFGAGITTSQVSVRRDDNDLVLRLSGGNGSVTVKDWFSSSAKRVEQVQFADGTVWNEQQIRAKVTSGGNSNHDDHHDHGGQHGHGNGHDHDDDGYDGHHGGRHDHKDHHSGKDRDCDDDCGPAEMRDAIAMRLRRNASYDFTALTTYLARNNGGGYGAMTAQQIAAQWTAVQDVVSNLAHNMDYDDCGGGHSGHGHGWGCDDRDGGHGNNGKGWGHHGSTGQQRGWGGMDGFCGLGEGFRKL